MSQASRRRTARKIRYHDHEWDDVVARANAFGFPPATFVREVSLDVDRQETELVVALGRVATELYGLMRHAPAPTHTEIQLVLNETLAVIRGVGSR